MKSQPTTEHIRLTTNNPFDPANNNAQLPDVFRKVVEETLRHFFDAIHQKRDQEQSWKKAIYKIIARLDCEVPELFKSREFDELLNSHGWWTDQLDEH